GEEPARALAADALRRVPDPEPGRVPVQEPGGLERDAALRRRRRAAAVARRERQPPALAGDRAPAPGRDRRAPGGAVDPRRLLGLGQPGGVGRLLAPG